MLTLKQIFKNTVFEGHENILTQKLTEAAVKFSLSKTFSKKTVREFLEEHFPEMKEILKDRYDFFVVLCKEMIERQEPEIQESEYINAITNIENDNHQIELISQI